MSTSLSKLSVLSSLKKTKKINVFHYMSLIGDNILVWYASLSLPSDLTPDFHAHIRALPFSLFHSISYLSHTYTRPLFYSPLCPISYLSHAYLLIYFLSLSYPLSSVFIFPSRFYPLFLHSVNLLFCQRKTYEHSDPHIDQTERRCRQIEIATKN
jgi:hypothetical protein